MIPSDNIRYVGIIEVICGVWLLIGIRLNEQSKLVPCMIVRSLYVLGGTLGPILNSNSFNDKDYPNIPAEVNIAACLIIAAINAYMLAVIYSFYQVMGQYLPM
ncbi:uncharacterized protein LOC129565175 [Sitodiplosis mosellana]|uniref:uncharacterized protein LOC129565175 n=1 Tax=Sitodiplosis mosellana TaxID=263140 RepID=UPI0024442822|nr:uncharacterized protein LOC129565175 [Sitodiplosis mosellana]